eukprot:scaffold2470_cov340-Prasinococcus_capsulatus_cf.AAC.6
MPADDIMPFEADVIPWDTFSVRDHSSPPNPTLPTAPAHAGVRWSAPPLHPAPRLGTRKPTPCAAGRCACGPRTSLACMRFLGPSPKCSKTRCGCG